eukprot:2162354-Rhodomonas_salina.2
MHAAAPHGNKRRVVRGAWTRARRSAASFCRRAASSAASCTSRASLAAASCHQPTLREHPRASQRELEAQTCVSFASRAAASRACTRAASCSRRAPASHTACRTTCSPGRHHHRWESRGMSRPRGGPGCPGGRPRSPGCAW